MSLGKRHFPRSRSHAALRDVAAPKASSARSVFSQANHRSRARLLLACDLQHADVGDACGLADLPEALATRYGFLDGLAPFDLGSEPPRGCAADTGQGSHLGEEEPLVCLLAGEALRHERFDGLHAVRLVDRVVLADDSRDVALGVGQCRADVLVSGHTGNLAYRWESVK